MIEDKKQATEQCKEKPNWKEAVTINVRDPNNLIYQQINKINLIKSRKEFKKWQ